MAGSMLHDPNAEPIPDVGGPRSEFKQKITKRTKLCPQIFITFVSFCSVSVARETTRTLNMEKWFVKALKS